MSGLNTFFFHLSFQPVDVVMVDIDYGELRIPELAHILSFPGDLVQPIKAALSKVKTESCCESCFY